MLHITEHVTLATCSKEFQDRFKTEREVDAVCGIICTYTEVVFYPPKLFLPTIVAKLIIFSLYNKTHFKLLFGSH